MPPPRGTSAETLLAYAFAVRAFTATEAIDATGLTRSTVLSACEELIRLGWVRELDDARAAGEYRMGRPARRYELDTATGVVVGVDAGQHRVTALVADLRGTVLGRSAGDLGESGLEVPVRLRVLAETVDAALADAAVPAARVLVTVVGIPAPVDAGGASPGDGGFWDRMNPGFAGAVPGDLVVVENDANLAALAERPSSGEASFAALLSGERFGAGLVVDGVLLRGAHGGAGEMRVLEIVDGVGSSDGIGAAARTLVVEAVAAGDVATGGSLGPDSDAAAVFAAARAGDSVACTIVDRLGDRLARVCVLLASLLDIDRVVVAGAIAVPAAPVIERARALLDGWHFDPVPEIVASSLGADVVVIGAVAHAVDAVRADPLSFALVDRPGPLATVV
ncbi:Sugar kinase of the NBD/HSP70 family, may contain an N-terminal HTH domain [Curtobacterium sp. UNCCL20]|uniref:ROK family protein n=1 Tax=Curtobacterium sp. UNCCL20 TaxID=1502773 RepID=UPI00088FCE42|nr:ROK family protein [Curtobacterium sp. UNCCL20]SDQ65005.1 Sugar kinase of the NBD/HSP70 family, may contain an N-terminal HTH domain [Curtobacterium sp. UNCCL20]